MDNRTTLLKVLLCSLSTLKYISYLICDLLISTPPNWSRFMYDGRSIGQIIRVPEIPDWSYIFSLYIVSKKRYNQILILIYLRGVEIYVYRKWQPHLGKKHSLLHWIGDAKPIFFWIGDVKPICTYFKKAHIFYKVKITNI